MFAKSASLLLTTLLSGTLQGSGATARLAPWAWALEPTSETSRNSATAGGKVTAGLDALDWKPVETPWVEVGGERVVSLWFRWRGPAFPPSDEGYALFFPTQPRAFDVVVGDEVVYHYPGSSSDSPWHMVQLPPGSEGRPLYLHMVWRPNRLGKLGFPFGVRVGSRADHYLWMVRQDWRSTALALMFVFTAIVALGAHLAAALRKVERPYAALALLCLFNAIWVLTDQAYYLGGLVLGRQDLHKFWWITGPLAPAAELWYMERLYGRKLRFGLRGIAALLAAAGLFIGLGRWSELTTVEDTSYWYSTLVLNVLAFAAAASTLANIASFWPTCSRALKVVTIGLVLEQACCLIDAVECIALTNLPRPAGLGFSSFLVFVLASPVVAELEARAREERERAANARARAITETTAMFAHDVRKPFAILRATLDALSEAKTRAEMSEVLGSARAETEQVTRSVEAMIADILEAASNAPPETAPESLQAILHTVISDFEAAGSARDVKLHDELQHRRAVDVHRPRVERALANIVGNALEAMRGHGHLWLRSRDVVHRGRPFVELALGNSGPQIPKEHLQRIFQPFFTTGKRNGTGLGLALTHKVIDAHGGTITCRSSAKEGVWFTLTLPACDADLPLPGPLPRKLGTPSRPSTPATAPRGGSVLLVEDSPSMRRAWRRTLAGEELREFASPSECLEAIEAEPGLLESARCVVLDNRFAPGEIDGLTFGEVLRRRTRVPILLCSGVVEDPLPPWFDGQIPKQPLASEELNRTLLGFRSAPRTASCA